MDPTRRAYLELHIAVFLFGFTAILGELIQLSALVMVWWRVLITSLSLLLIVRLRTFFGKLSAPDILRFMGIGVLVALHWVAFYGSIKLANASVALVAFATTSLFTSIIEPILLRTRIKLYEVILGLLVIPGMILIVNNIDLSLMKGLWVGLLAALLAALFATLNKMWIRGADEKGVTLLELGSAWLFLCLVLPVVMLTQEEPLVFWPSALDWLYLLLLALLCTTLAYVLALRSLRYLSAFASNLSVNMEPVYGIILAWIVLDNHKELSPGFYWGVVVILISVFSYPVMRRIFRERVPR